MVTLIRAVSLLSFSGLLALARHYSLGHLYGLSLGPSALTTILAPSIGFFARPWACGTVWLARTLLLILDAPQLASSFLYLPTLAGSLVLSSESKALKCFIPLLCIAFFIAHPIGADCWLYTLYWVIPILLCGVTTTLFLRSLASTFTTHAVGSTLYIYTHTTTSSFWHTLIAQVWYERLIYAMLLTLASYGITQIVTLVTTYRSQRNPCRSPLSSL